MRNYHKRRPVRLCARGHRRWHPAASAAARPRARLHRRDEPWCASPPQLVMRGAPPRRVAVRGPARYVAHMSATPTVVRNVAVVTLTTCTADTVHGLQVYHLNVA